MTDSRGGKSVKIVIASRVQFGSGAFACLIRSTERIPCTKYGWFCGCLAGDHNGHAWLAVSKLPASMLHRWQESLTIVQGTCSVSQDRIMLLASAKRSFCGRAAAVCVIARTCLVNYDAYAVAVPEQIRSINAGFRIPF